MAKRSGLDLLFGDKIPGAKFPQIGAEVEGTILSIDSRQRRDYDPKKPGRQGEPMWWQDGSPVAFSKEQAKRLDLTADEDGVWDPVILLQTKESTGRGDDGRRNLFVNSQLMRVALRESTEEGQKFEIGGRLKVTHTGLGEASEAGGNQPKDYEAVYTAPAPKAAGVRPKPEDDDPWA